MGHRAMRITYTILIGNSEETRPLQRTKHRWNDNIKIHVQEILCEGVNWIHVVQDRAEWWALANTVMKIRVS
jgi:hypothetical protein